jgi:predicted ArsR family transcriptional regulator
MQEQDPLEAVQAIGLLDEPVRRRLYDWVVRQPEPVGREQSARALGITRALATFHLDKLVAGGLLQADYRRLSGKVGPGAGRPARIYWRAAGEITASAPDRRYGRVAGLFATALEQLGGGGPPPVLADAARRLGTTMGTASRRGSERTRLTTALERGGYQPLTDAHGTVRLRNCPFDALASEHRELVCGTNLAFAEGLAAGSGVTGLRPVLDRQPGYCCVTFVPTERS